MIWSIWWLVLFVSVFLRHLNMNHSHNSLAFPTFRMLPGEAGCPGRLLAHRRLCMSRRLSRSCAETKKGGQRFSPKTDCCHHQFTKKTQDNYEQYVHMVNIFFMVYDHNTFFLTRRKGSYEKNCGFKSRLPGWNALRSLGLVLRGPLCDPPLSRERLAASVLVLVGRCFFGPNFVGFFVNCLAMFVFLGDFQWVFVSWFLFVGFVFVHVWGIDQRWGERTFAFFQGGKSRQRLLLTTEFNNYNNYNCLGWMFILNLSTFVGTETDRFQDGSPRQVEIDDLVPCVSVPWIPQMLGIKLAPVPVTKIQRPKSLASNFTLPWKHGHLLILLITCSCCLVTQSGDLWWTTRICPALWLPILIKLTGCFFFQFHGFQT